MGIDQGGGDEDAPRGRQLAALLDEGLQPEAMEEL